MRCEPLQECNTSCDFELEFIELEPADQIMNSTIVDTDWRMIITRGLDNTFE